MHLTPKHAFDVVVVDVVRAKITELPLVPERRISEDGKSYTPPMVSIVCSSGTLLFVLEDITAIAGLFGPVINVAGFGAVTFTRIIK